MAKKVVSGFSLKISLRPGLVYRVLTRRVEKRSPLILASLAVDRIDGRTTRENRIYPCDSSQPGCIVTLFLFFLFLFNDPPKSYLSGCVLLSFILLYICLSGRPSDFLVGTIEFLHLQTL